MPITIKDVARIAEVSVSTVSNVINSKPGVHPVLRERVEDVIRRTGYIPSTAARNLVCRKAGCIGFFLARSARSGLLDSLYDDIIQGVEEELQARGSMMIFSSVPQDSPETDAALMGKIGKIDGMILAGFDTRRELDLLRQQGVPITLVNRSDTDRLIPSVSVDFFGGTQAAVEYLLTLGHRRILLISGPASHVGTESRREAYFHALDKASISADRELVVESSWSVEAGIDAVKISLIKGIQFTAICAATDALAYGALVALREAGLRVPEQVSVIGFGDITNAATMVPPLTTARADGREVGRRAVLLLGNSDTPAPQVVIPAELVIRASTAQCSVRNRVSRRRSLL